MKLHVYAYKHSIAIALLLSAGFPGVSLATSDICKNEKHSSKEIVVNIPRSGYGDFVKLIENGEIVPIKPPLAYGGGIETDRIKTWSLHNDTYTIGVHAEYSKSTHDFVFWVQTCGTKESWRPSWQALRARAKGFPGATVSERIVSTYR